MLGESSLPDLQIGTLLLCPTWHGVRGVRENFEAGHWGSAAQRPLHPNILFECGHLLQPSETHPDPSTGSGDAWLACGFPWVAVKVTLDEHARGS